jgi:hypothetical protein
MTQSMSAPPKSNNDRLLLIFGEVADAADKALRAIDSGEAPQDNRQVLVDRWVETVGAAVMISAQTSIGRRAKARLVLAVSRRPSDDELFRALSVSLAHDVLR